MPNDTRSICSHTTRNGSPCRAAAACRGKSCCTFHDPELAARRSLQAGAPGGRLAPVPAPRSAARSVGGTEPTSHFTGVGDVVYLLAATASQVRRAERLM